MTAPINDPDGLPQIGLDTYRECFGNRCELFMPFNEILASNAYLHDISDGIMNVATDEGGDIGGFLISHEINYPVHAYNEKAMVQLETEIPGTTGGLNTFLINAKEKLPIEKLTIVEEYLAGLNKQKINELGQMPIFLQN